MPRSLPFIYAADELADALTERLERIFADAKLTTAQFSVLYALIEEGPMKLSALAERQRCVKSNVTYLTRAMQRDGVVELAEAGWKRLRGRAAPREGPPDNGGQENVTDADT